MKQYPIRGTEAYAPVPVEQPSHLPEEPKRPQTEPQTKKATVSPFTIAGTAVALVLAFCVLFSMVRLFEARSENAELQRQAQELKTRQDILTAKYESSIDLDAVEKRAQELGMHLPWAEQVEYIDVKQPEAVKEIVEETKIGFFEAFQLLIQDLQAYFS